MGSGIFTNKSLFFVLFIFVLFIFNLLELEMFFYLFNIGLFFSFFSCV